MDAGPRAQARLPLALIVALAVALCGSLAACENAAAPARVPAPPPAPSVAGSFEARLEIALAPLRPANARLLGQNVQWQDRGDGLLDADGHLDAQRLQLVRALRPTVLRYPGGSNADTYRWMAGRGPLAERGSCEPFFERQAQPVLFGTGEFLRLCRELGAEPLLSVNIATASAQEAADWLAAIQHDEFRDAGGQPLGPVSWWEIGNEPYLREELRPELGAEPAQTARRIDATIAALRAVDPRVQVGIPLRSEKLGTIAAVHFPGYAQTLLDELKQPFDFVALHDAYMPFLFDGRGGEPAALFAATMAASRAVEADLAATRALLARARPGQRIPLAITEYNALYALQPPLDQALAGLAGALFASDALALFARSEDVLLANYWSLSGNWFFGALAQDGRPRAAYHVLAAWSRVLRGDLLAAAVVTPGFDSPALGIVPAYEGTPLVTATVTRDGDTLRALLINKDWSRAGQLSLALATAAGAGAGAGEPPPRVAQATASVLSCDDPFDADDARARSGLQPLAVTGEAFPLALSLPPRSLVLVEIELGAP